MRRYHTFERTFEQTTIALECLEKALDNYQDELPKATMSNPILPYLIHATVLLFLNRDQHAFQSIYESPVHHKLALGERLRQLPTLVQLQAVLNSRKSDPTWQTLTEEELNTIQAISNWSDEALGIQHLKAFRDQLLINGVPPEEVPATEPFSVPTFDYVILSNAALAAWQKLNRSN